MGIIEEIIGFVPRLPQRHHRKQGNGRLDGMKSGRKFVVAIFVCMLLLGAGCDKFLNKKKPPTIPPRAEAPTIYQPLPDKIPEPYPEPLSGRCGRRKAQGI